MRTALSENQVSLKKKTYNLIILTSSNIYIYIYIKKPIGFHNIMREPESVGSHKN